LHISAVLAEQFCWTNEQSFVCWHVNS